MLIDKLFSKNQASFIRLTIFLLPWTITIAFSNSNWWSVSTTCILIWTVFRGIELHTRVQEAMLTIFPVFSMHCVSLFLQLMLFIASNSEALLAALSVFLGWILACGWSWYRLWQEVMLLPPRLCWCPEWDAIFYLHDPRPNQDLTRERNPSMVIFFI